MLRISLALSLLAAPCAGQTFSNLYPGQFLRDLLVAPGGDLVVLSETSILVLDPDGSVQLNLETPGTTPRAICTTSDGGFAVSGSGSGASPYVARFDGAWNRLWDRKLSGFDIYGGRLQAIFQLPSGNLQAVGYAPYYSGSYYAIARPLHLELDLSGAVQRLVTSDLAFVLDAAMRPDGSYFSIGNATVGYDTTPGLGDTVLQLWDASGQQVAQTWPTPRVAWAQQVVVTADGGCLVRAERLLRFDAQGQVLWQREYLAGPDQLALLHGMATTADGGVILAGSVRIDDRWHGRLLKLDMNAQVEWDRAYGDADGEASFTQVVPYGGGYVVGGGKVLGTLRTWVARVDAEGLLPGCETIPLSTSIVEHAIDDQALALSESLLNRPPMAAGEGFPPSTVTPEPWCFSPTLGTRYCSPAVINSSGAPAELHVGGSSEVADPSVLLIATSVPADQFGYFVVGDGTGTVVPPGSQGNLCLVGGTLHRYADQIRSSGWVGALSLYPDTTTIPGHGAVQPGETWNFQCWFRDNDPQPTSNFTDAVGVTFH